MNITKTHFIKQTCFRKPAENHRSYYEALQNSETHLKNASAFSRVSDHPKKLCDKRFQDVIVRYQIKFLKLVCYIFYFNQMIFKSSFTKWVEVIAFVSLSVRLFQRRGPREDTASLIALNYILGSMKFFSLCLVG